MFVISQVVSGVQSTKARWRDCVAMVQTRLGMAVGYLYIKEVFPEKYKAEVRAARGRYSRVKCHFMRNNFSNARKNTRRKNAAMGKHFYLKTNIHLPEKKYK